MGYWYAHLALIAGIILVAAWIRQLLEGHEGMALLAGGMVLFMLGDVFFRWVMGMSPIAAVAIAIIAVERRMESR